MAGSHPLASPEVKQLESGDVVSTGMRVPWKADPALGLDVEPTPREAQPRSHFRFLDYRDPSDVLLGSGDNGVWPPHKRLDHAQCLRSHPLEDAPCQTRFSHAAQSWAAGAALSFAAEGRISKKDFENVL